MIPAMLDLLPPIAVQASAEAHILVVSAQGASRYAIASQLLDAGLCVTTAASFGVVEVLIDGAEAFDAMIVVQTADQITQFGVAQLARSMHPDLPIVVLEAEAAVGPGVLELVQGALARWPLRDFANRLLH